MRWRAGGVAGINCYRARTQAEKGTTLRYINKQTSLSGQSNNVVSNSRSELSPECEKSISLGHLGAIYQPWSLVSFWEAKWLSPLYHFLPLNRKWNNSTHILPVKMVPERSSGADSNGLDSSLSASVNDPRSRRFLSGLLFASWCFAGLMLVTQSWGPGFSYALCWVPSNRGILRVVWRFHRCGGEVPYSDSSQETWTCIIHERRKSYWGRSIWKAYRHETRAEYVVGYLEGGGEDRETDSCSG